MSVQPLTAELFDLKTPKFGAKNIPCQSKIFVYVSVIRGHIQIIAERKLIHVK